MTIVARRLATDDADLGVKMASLFAGNDVHRDHVAAFLSETHNVLIAGSVNGTLAGFLTAHLLARFKDLRRKFLIYEVDVLPAYRRMGVGRSMIELSLGIAREAGADTSFVLTNRSNDAAVRLYESTGGRAIHPDDVMYVYEFPEASNNFVNKLM